MIESPAIRADLHVEPLKSNLQETSKMKKRILTVAVAAVFTVSPVYAKKDKDSTSAPQYEFVDGNGEVLGDVLFIEDRLHAFGYFNYLSTNRIIEVIATTSKEGEPINGYRFSGNFIQKNVLYADNLCNTIGHTNGGSREIGMLNFLQSDSYIYWPNMDRTTWTELVLSEVPAPSGNQDWYIKIDSDSPCIFSYNGDISPWAVQIESYGEELDAPVPPILVVAKP